MQGQRSNKFKIGIVILIIGLIIGVIFVVMLVNYINKRKVYVETTAIVVDYDERFDSEGFYLYAPIYEYLVDGITYTKKDSTYSSNPPAINSEVKIRYNKDDPGDIILEKDNGLIVVGICAFGFVVAGIVFTISGKREKMA